MSPSTIAPTAIAATKNPFHSASTSSPCLVAESGAPKVGSSQPASRRAPATSARRRRIGGNIPAPRLSSPRICHRAPIPELGCRDLLATVSHLLHWKQQKGWVRASAHRQRPRRTRFSRPPRRWVWQRQQIHVHRSERQRQCRVL